jgi:hypothetical protein
MAELLNLLISTRILLSFPHYLPHITSSASKNLMNR